MKKFLIFVILFSICLSGYAASSDLKELLNAVKTMQANFTQTVNDNRGKSVQKSYGRMTMQRPGKFRWEVTKPIPQLIIANGSRLWIYDPDLQQVTIRSLNSGSGGAPALLLSHVDTALDRDFKVKELPNKTPGWSWFALTPRQQDNMFASIQMGFSNKQIREMQLKDHLGHTTFVRFTNSSINHPLPSSSFVLNAPSSADVIDETKHQ